MGKREFLKRHLLTTVGIATFASILIGILSYGLFLDPTKVPAANIGKDAYKFNVAAVQGGNPEGRLKLDDLIGKPMILNFWASWCVSCREEARELEAFWRKHREDVLVVGIAIQDQAEEAKRFAAHYGKTYPLGLDEDGKAAIDYGVSGVPETFLIDKQGRIIHKEVGPVSSAQLEALLPKLKN